MTQLNLPQTNQPQIQEFEFNTNQIRVIDKDGELWFIAADVCEVLGLSNPTMALKRLDDDEYALNSIEGITKGNESTNLVNESGLYSLVLGSKKKAAKEFKRWVTHEILPSIRKTGSYSVSQQPQLDAPSTVEARKPITKILAVWVGCAPITYREAWHMVHAHFGVASVEELKISQIQAVTDWIQERIDVACGQAPDIAYKPSAEYIAMEKELTVIYNQFDENTILSDIDLKNTNGTLSLIFDMKRYFKDTLIVAANYEKILIRLQKFEADYLKFSLFRKMLTDRK